MLEILVPVPCPIQTYQKTEMYPFCDETKGTQRISLLKFTIDCHKWKQIDKLQFENDSNRKLI